MYNDLQRTWTATGGVLVADAAVIRLRSPTASLSNDHEDVEDDAK